MKKLLFVAALAAALTFTAVAQADIVVTGDNADCDAAHFPEKIDDTTGGPTASGITSVGDDELVTVTVPDGVTVDHICVKTGQSGDAQVNTTVPFVGPGTFTIEKVGEGGGISHLQFGTSPSGDDGDGADVGGPDGDDSVDSVDGGDVSPGDGDDVAGTTDGTTGGTGAPSGGTTGGAPTPTGGNLPFTGLPVWVPLLVAFALLGSGFVLLRRKGHVS